MLELSGIDRICHINIPLYYYREHNNNTYKVVESKSKQIQKLIVK